eukprot:766352-Hanusia_phi.AAC.1
MTASDEDKLPARSLRRGGGNSCRSPAGEVSPFPSLSSCSCSCSCSLSSFYSPCPCTAPPPPLLPSSTHMHIKFLPLGPVVDAVRALQHPSGHAAALPAAISEGVVGGAQEDALVLGVEVDDEPSVVEGERVAHHRSLEHVVLARLDLSHPVHRRHALEPADDAAEAALGRVLPAAPPRRPEAIEQPVGVAVHEELELQRLHHPRVALLHHPHAPQLRIFELHLPRQRLHVPVLLHHHGPYAVHLSSQPIDLPLPRELLVLEPVYLSLHLSRLLSCSCSCSALYLEAARSLPRVHLPYRHQRQGLVSRLLAPAH